MMDYKVEILHLLLNKYEKSRYYYGDAQVKRRIILKFNKKEFPLYNIEKAEVKEAVHYAVMELKQMGVIEFQWMKFEEGNLLDKAILNIEKVHTAYKLAGRKAKQDIVTEAWQKLKFFRNDIKTAWMCNFLDKMVMEIETKKVLPEYIPAGEEELGLLLNTFKGIEDKGPDEMLERIFSRKYLGGSKIFEKKMRNRIARIAKDFMLEQEDLEKEEVLQYIGIIKSSEELLFSGPLVIRLFDEVIDFTPFCYGASMNTEMIKDFVVDKLAVKRVISIENKAVYLEYIKRQKKVDEFIIYLGGFYSPVKRIFLEKIYEYVQENNIRMEFYHWGDIDLGGFKIFVQLKNNIIKELHPLNMDVNILRKYARYGDPFSESYRKKVKKLLEKEEYEVFYGAIKAMLELGIKLEQEALV